MPRSLFGLWLLALTLSIVWIAWPDRVEKKEGALASVASIQGNVSIRPAGSFSWTSARVGSQLLALDAIATGSRSRVELRLENGASIVLPEDTQIKLQAQTVIPGMIISLIKGGVEVQAEGVLAEEVLSSDKKRKFPQAVATVAAARPITIQTNSFSVDLSRLEGQFKLMANAGAEASRPETIRVQNTKGAISLAQLGDSSAPNLEEQLEESLPEIPSLPVKVEEPTLPLPRPAPTSLKKLEMVPEPDDLPGSVLESEKELMDETPVPETLPLVEEPLEQLVPPLLKDTQLVFWSVGSVEESAEIPLVFPMAKPQPVFNTTRWQSILRISIRSTSAPMIIKREPGSLGMFFSLYDIQGLIGERSLEGLQLTVETGLMKRSDENGELLMADRKTQVTLRSLDATQELTLQMDGWRFVEPTDQWIRSPRMTQSDAMIHILEPSILKELEGYLRGARAFAVQPLQAMASLATVHFVRGKSIVASTDTVDNKFIKSLINRLRPDLVYLGSSQAFLGGKGSFDLNKEASRTGDLYYVRRTSVLKMDRNLFKTHSAARAFIRNFDPYFMSLPVTIIYSKE